jgi:very-short-patch-repair endonuclease
MLPWRNTPSSDPSGHLLPAGEKTEIAELLAQKFTGNECLWDAKGAASSLFSPAGRRWPEGSDEGGCRMQNPKKVVTKRRSGSTQKARSLRQNETEPEYRLWSELRNRLLNGHKFSRQIPIGTYVVDFICREKLLIVELDGIQHVESEHDVIRTRWLNENGYSVLRFWNHEILGERRAVLETILAVLTGEISSHDDAIRFSPSAFQRTKNEENNR